MSPSDGYQLKVSPSDGYFNKKRHQVTVILTESGTNCRFKHCSEPSRMYLCRVEEGAEEHTGPAAASSISDPSTDFDTAGDNGEDGCSLVCTHTHTRGH